jgi:hypothetical protein
MIHHYTPAEIADLPPADVIQVHDAGEEADPLLQDGLHQLARRCSECGQALPEGDQKEIIP